MVQTSRCVVLAAIAAAFVSACGNSEPPAAKARPNAPLEARKAQVDAPAPTADANEALKDRLARQDAATKLFEKAKPEPAPPKPEPRKAEPVKAEPVKAEPIRAAAAPAATPSPTRAAAKAVEAPKVEAARPEPVKVEPAAPPPRTEVAAARPSANPPVPAVAPGLAPAKLVTRVEPEFPREAIKAGNDRGLVKARMTLDMNGNVTRVEVVEANPRRVFDRAVVRALSQWRFSDGPSGRTVETEVEFKADR